MANFDLHASLSDEFRFEDDVDPMSTIANLADVMLVFACGLMVALVVAWNVDLSTVTEMLQEDQIAEVQSPENVTDQLKASDGTAYIDMGRIYMDPTTGKYYMITEGGTVPVTDGVANADDAEGSDAAVEAADSARSSAGTAGDTGNAVADRSQGAD